MAEYFNMPKLGMDMTEGTVVKWLKKPGDAVEKGEPLAEIETDKSVVEVESAVSGVLLKCYCAEGESLPCGTALAAIGARGETAPHPGPPDQRADGSPASNVPVADRTETAAAREEGGEGPKTSGERKRRISPRARRLAERNQVDIADIAGSGPGGRIVERDVRRWMERGPGPATGRWKHLETVTPLTGVRKITAARMRQSLSEAAQTSHRVDVDMGCLLEFRGQLLERRTDSEPRVSIVDLLVAACARALMEHPAANAVLREDGLHMMNYANIGVAVDTDRGLLVPVIQEANALSLGEISRKSRELIDKARRGALAPGEMSGGTFTISNLGMYEIDSFTAIINPPETCILAVGRITDRAVPRQGQIEARPMATLSLTYDHRVLDGAPAARFLQTIKGYIEHPAWLLL